MTRTAGWIAIAFGGAHLIVAPWDTRAVWSRVAEDGWWNTFTLKRATTIDELQRSETFWVSVGSFGAPMLILGCYIVWATRRQTRVPGWMGGILVAWGLALVTVLPVSPGWAIPVVGALIVLGDRARGRASARHGHAVASGELVR